MSSRDIEIIRDRISVLKDKTESLSVTFSRPDIQASLTPVKQTYWRERVDHLNRNVQSLPVNLDRAMRNF